MSFKGSREQYCSGGGPLCYFARCRYDGTEGEKKSSKDEETNLETGHANWRQGSGGSLLVGVIGAESLDLCDRPQAHMDGVMGYATC